MESTGGSHLCRPTRTGRRKIFDFVGYGLGPLLLPCTRSRLPSIRRGKTTLAVSGSLVM